MAAGGVKILQPAGAIAPTGTWSLGTRAGDFVFVAGMRGIDPGHQQDGRGWCEARVRLGFRNMLEIAASEGAKLTDCMRIVVYVTDMDRLRPLVNKVQEELWAGRALSAPHHRRGGQAQPGRRFRGGRDVLRPENGLIGGHSPLGWRAVLGYIYRQATAFRRATGA